MPLRAQPWLLDALLMKTVRTIIESIDRYLPVALFAFMLSVQGLLASGAADSIVFPELRGPDGRVLTFAELCNSVGEDGASAKHCSSCSLHGKADLPAAATVSFDQPPSNEPGLPAAVRFLPKTPERWQYYRRGPPAQA